VERFGIFGRIEPMLGKLFVRIVLPKDVRDLLFLAALVLGVKPTADPSSAAQPSG
jgi:hypothetical protein